MTNWNPVKPEFYPVLPCEANGITMIDMINSYFVRNDIVNIVVTDKFTPQLDGDTYWPFYVAKIVDYCNDFGIFYARHAHAEGPHKTEQYPVFEFDESEIAGILGSNVDGTDTIVVQLPPEQIQCVRDMFKGRNG